MKEQQVSNAGQNYLQIVKWSVFQGILNLLDV